MVSDDLVYTCMTELRKENNCRGRPGATGGRYAAQDRVEMEALGVAEMAKDATILQTQIDSATVQLTTISRRIQKTAAKNAALRREINMLRRRLANKPCLSQHEHQARNSRASASACPTRMRILRHHQSRRRKSAHDRPLSAPSKRRRRQPRQPDLLLHILQSVQARLLAILPRCPILVESQA